MRSNTQERLVTWMDESQVIGFQHRNWRAVRCLAAAAVIFLLATLPAEYLLGSTKLANGCWIAGALASAAMLIWFYNDRLQSTRILAPER